MKKIVFLSPYSRSLFIKGSIVEYGGAEVKVFNLVNILSKNKNYDTSVIIDSAFNNQDIIKENNVNLIALGLLFKAQRLTPFLEFITKFLSLFTLNRFLFLKKILKPFKITSVTNLFNRLEEMKNKFLDIDYIKYKITEFNINKQIKFIENNNLKFDYCFCFGLNQQSYLFMKRFKSRNISRQNIMYLGSDNDLNFKSQFYGEINSTKRKCLEICDYVVCQNIFQRDKIKLYLPNKKVFILPNSIDMTYKYDFTNILERKYDVIWVGKLDKVKNPIIALNIARKLKKYRFLFLFNIQDNRYNFFDLLLRFKTDNVEFKIDVDYDTSDKYFSNSKIYMNTSRFEGFPNALLQAGKYGCPFVSLKVNPDNIFDNKIGFKSNSSKKKIINNIINLLENKSQMEFQSKNILEYTLKKHSYEKIKIKLKEIL